MRILVVQDADWTKKGPHQQHHLIDRLSVRGHKVLVIGFDQLWRLEEGGLVSKRVVVHGVSRTISNAGVTFIRTRFLRLPVLDYASFSWAVRQEVKRALSEFRPEIVIGFTSVLSNYWAAYYAAKAGIPFIYYWTDVIHTLVPRPYRPLALALEKEILRLSARTVVINDALGDVLVNKFKIDPGAIETIGGGVNLGLFDAQTSQSLETRNDLGLRESDLVMFFMGWIYPASGLQDVIAEMARIRDETLKLIIVGDGDYCKELEELVQDLRISSRVLFLGRRPHADIPRLLSAADVCILPAHYSDLMRDVVPIKMYEYMAAGRAVIATRLPGILREFGFGNGVHYVDRPQDVVTRATELRARGQLEAEGHRARTFAASRDWSVLLKRFERLLESLVAQGSRATGIPSSNGIDPAI